MDGTHIEAHQYSSGGNENLQCISKSVAERATKIRLSVDALRMATQLPFFSQMVQPTM